LVFDHFHVVKLMNDRLQTLRRELYHELTDKLQKEVLKGTRWLLLKNPENLDGEKGEKERLEEALRLNAPLAQAYYMKEDLRRIWQQGSKEAASRVLGAWIERAGSSGCGELQRLGRTLQK